MDTVYYIWGLLPVALTVITLRAIVKRILKRPGREYAIDYGKQAAFCWVLLFAAIGIDQSFLDSILSEIPFGEADPRIFRWLLYPALLGVAAYIQHIFDKKAEDKEREERHKRQTNYIQRHF